MKTTPLQIAAVVACMLLLAVPATAEDASPQSSLIKSKAGTVVALKYVLNMERGGRTQERNASATGVMIDSSGLVMTPASNFSPAAGVPPALRAMFAAQMRGVKATPSNIRIIFPGDEKEHPAILGAKDSKFGLAFILIKDLGDKKVEALDMLTVAEPKVGDVLYGVSRMGQGFDYAPLCTQVRVIGQVTKPRPMWTLDDASEFTAQPLYNATGAVAGICVYQSGVGEEAATRPFVLPLKVAAATVRMAKKESERALEELLEAEEEAAAEAEEAKAAEAEKAKEGDGDKPAEGDGDKPAEGDGDK